MFTNICFIVAIISLILALYSAIKAHGYKTRLDRIDHSYHSVNRYLAAGKGYFYTMESLMATLNECLHN